MALTDGSMSPADFAAINGNDGFGGNNGWWIILLLLCGWGNGGFGGFGNNGGVGAEVQRGFDQSALMSAVQGTTTAVTSGTADVISTLNTLAMTLTNSCCDQKLGIANLGYQIASDGCSTRSVFSDAMRDMIMANYQNSQAQLAAINAVGDRLDGKLCQLELDAKNDKIADLQRQLTYAQTVADNAGQTAQIIANNEAQTVALERYLAPTPIPAYVVQNPNCCPQFGTCGCGM